MEKIFVFEEIFNVGDGVGDDDGGTGGNVELDTTLTEEGKAADAKAVGDALEGKADKDDIVEVDKNLLKEGYAADALSTGRYLRDLENMLEEHQANDQHHSLDKTLTKEDDAADAKAVGDAINNVDLRVDDVEDELANKMDKNDKVSYWGFDRGENKSVTILPSGIGWRNDQAEIPFTRKDGTTYYLDAPTSNRVPIVAGSGISFEVDDTNKVVKIKATGGGTSGVPGGGGIIEVLELPTENIDTRYLYRVTKAALYAEGMKQGTTYVVAELPATGEAVTLDGLSINATYYNDTDNTPYAYVPDAIGAALGVPAGWYDVETLLGVFGFPYGGIVTNLADMIEPSAFYILLTNPLYSNEDGKWYEVATTGAALAMKTRVFRDWQEAIMFCITNNVYKIQVENLNFVYNEGQESGEYVTTCVTSANGSIYATFLNSWSSNPSYINVAIYVDVYNGAQRVNYTGHCVEYNYYAQKVSYKSLNSIDGSNMGTATVYYFV